MTSKDEIGKQRVQSVHRDARPVAWDDGNGGVGGYEIWSNSDTKCLGEGRFEEAAWQNAAESLPAQPEQELCPYCRETKDKCLSNEYCYSTHWEVAPVEAKEKERCTSCNAVLPHKRFSRCWKSRVAEPKPTPSTPTALFRLEGDYIYCNKCNRGNPIIYGSQHYTDCELCIIPAKPQPDSSSIPDGPETDFVRDLRSYGAGEGDKQFGITRSEAKWIVENLKPARDSSSISTEQTFEEWAAIYDKSLLAPRGGRKAGKSIVARAAWAAAKGQSNGR